MILLSHIVIALSSVAYSAYVLFRPSAARLRVSYSLVGATVASGTVLLITKPSHLLQSCLMGLLFIGVSSAMLIFARQRLASAEAK